MVGCVAQVHTCLQSRNSAARDQASTKEEADKKSFSAFFSPNHRVVGFPGERELFASFS